MKTREQVQQEMNEGHPPPLMTEESASEAAALGKQMSGANAFERQVYDRFKNKHGEKP